MSTIESLDLASLSNNPQSIANALEDVLETTNNNIGLLKQQAQSDADDIQNTHLVNAQNDAQAINNLLNAVPNFSVTDIISNFTAQGNYEFGSQANRAYRFLDFVFFNFYIVNSSGPVDAETMIVNSDSATFPNDNYYIKPAGWDYTYPVDDAGYFAFKEDGTIQVRIPSNVGHSGWYVYVNGWYHV